jgi:O6-methylguanine-DNA--protein-cysteine methyltransferase
VLSEGGRLGGYRWGPDLKFALLQRETAACRGV